MLQITGKGCSRCNTANLFLELFRCTGNFAVIAFGKQHAFTVVDFLCQRRVQGEDGFKFFFVLIGQNV